MMDLHEDLQEPHVAFALAAVDFRNAIAGWSRDSLMATDEEKARRLSNRNRAANGFVESAQLLFGKIAETYPGQADHRGLAVTWPLELGYLKMAPSVDVLYHMVRSINGFIDECSRLAARSTWVFPEEDDNKGWVQL